MKLEEDVVVLSEASGTKEMNPATKELNEPPQETLSSQPRRGSMIERLKFYLVRRPALARSGVIMDLTAYCDRDTTFEGHNRIVAGAKIIESRLGVASYVGARSLLTRASIGRFTCIGPAVETVIGAHPTSGFVSIHPAFFSTKRQAGFTFVSRDLYPEFGTKIYPDNFLFDIGSDVWIGHGARLMQGVKIGHGAVIAAGSVVTKDVPPYTIVAGIPARPLKQRFPEATIKQLLDTAWWNLDFEQISHLAPHFSDPDSLLRELDKTSQARP